MLEKRLLPPATLDFIKEELYGKTLSELLIGLDICQGQVWTYLPAGANISPDYLATPQWGGLKYYLRQDSGIDQLDISNIYSAFLNHLQHFLAEKDTNICIFEAYSADASDPFLEKRKADPFIFFGEEVYTFVTSNLPDTTQIDKALRGATSYKLTGVLSSLPEKVVLQPYQQITLNLLTQVAADLKALILKAYDGESYLIWEPSGIG